jgi:transposase-like protein
VDPRVQKRRPEELAREFEPTAQSISTWVKQAERDAGKRADGATSAEREELGYLSPIEYERRHDEPTALTFGDALGKPLRLIGSQASATTSP